MNKKTILTAAFLSLALLLSSCNSKVPADTTTSAAPTSATSEITTTTTAVTTTSSEETTTTTSAYVPVPRDHVFNPHVLSEVCVMAYGEGFRENFFRYCDAVLAGEDRVALDKKAYYQQCRDTVRTCLPVADEYVCFMDTKEAKNKDGTYKLEYSIPKDEYLVKVEEFKTRICELINRACYEDDSYLESTLALYKSETERLEYDFSAAGNDITRGCNPYHALMYDNGICQEIAGAYAYLLLQVGVDATTCGALNNSNTESHEWTVVKIGDNYYHCDVTFQLNSKDTLDYFGMTDEKRSLEGDWKIKGFNFADSNIIWHKDLPIENGLFEPVWSATSYEIDREKNLLYCYDSGQDMTEPYFMMNMSFFAFAA